MNRSADLSERRAGEIDALGIYTYLLIYLYTYRLRGGPGGTRTPADFGGTRRNAPERGGPTSDPRPRHRT